MNIDRLLLLRIGKFFFVETIEKKETYFVYSKHYDRLMKIGLEIIYSIIMNYPEDIFEHVSEPKPNHVLGYVQFFKSKGVDENHPGKKKKYLYNLRFIYTMYFFNVADVILSNISKYFNAYFSR